jgi:hypothetical protein
VKGEERRASEASSIADGELLNFHFTFKMTTGMFVKTLERLTKSY